MRKLLLGFIILFALKGKAQTNVYHPFPDSNAVWLTGCSGLAYGGCACYGGYCLFSSTTQDSLGGDTTIGAYMYNKVWTESSNTLWNDGPTTCPPGVNNYSTTFYNYSYDGAIRQNISLKKVYYIAPLSTHDTLLYDFNLSLGDTLPATYINAANYAYVSKVDTFKISGNYHNRFWLWLVGTTPPTSSDSGYAAIIEGMGSTNGLFNVSPESFFESSCALNCIKINEASIYPSATTTCTSIYNTMGISQIKSLNTQIAIYPNPTKDVLNVECEMANEKATLTITDMLGNVVKQMPFNTQHITFNITDLNEGVYNISLQSNEGVVNKRLIIVR